MKVNISDKYEIIPEWNNNREEEEPIKFICSLLTSAQTDRYLSIGTDSIGFDRKVLFQMSVDKIVNLEVNGKKIITAEEFTKCKGLSQLYTEVTTEMMSRNNQEPGKNLE